MRCPRVYTHADALPLVRLAIQLPQFNSNGAMLKFRGDLLMPMLEIPPFVEGPAHICNRTWFLRAEALAVSNTSTWREVRALHLKEGKREVLVCRCQYAIRKLSVHETFRAVFSFFMPAGCATEFMRPT